MIFDGNDFDCNNCNKRNCLFKQNYYKLNNIPTKSVFYKRTVYITRENIWFYYDQIKAKTIQDFPVLKFIQTFIGICPKSIINNDAFEIFRRYQYCKTYNTQPFPGSYDDQPAEWLFMVDVIESEIYNLNQRIQNR